MNVGLHTGSSDSKTRDISETMYPVFTDLAERLQGEYGGIMEHLWIDLELVEMWSREDGRAKHPFRFQSRVSGHSRYGLPAVPDKFNVGHFSVRPDYEKLLSLSGDEIIRYVLSLIYSELSVLTEKKKRLEGFDASLFIKKFHDECSSMGYELPG